MLNSLWIFPKLYSICFQVSWIRKSDAHLLAVDKESFIADTRIIVVHSAVHDTWTLQIRGVKSSDTGDYECQVSSEPKISRIVSLSVVGKLLHLILFFLAKNNNLTWGHRVVIS